MSRFFVYLGRTPQRERERGERENFFFLSSSALRPKEKQPTRANNFQFFIRDTRRRRILREKKTPTNKRKRKWKREERFTRGCVDQRTTKKRDKGKI